MKLPRTLVDLGLSGPASYVATNATGTNAMEPAGMKLHELESEEARAPRGRRPLRSPLWRGGREDQPGRRSRVQREVPEPPQTEPPQTEPPQPGPHYRLAPQWAPLCPLLRRRTRVGPVNAGPATGAAMSVVVDELMTRAFGFSAPNLEYRLVTHLGGVAAHAVFGPVVAATVDAGRVVVRP